MAILDRSPRGKLRGQEPIAHSLDQVVQDTFRLWRKHHLDYDQIKYVVEQVYAETSLGALGNDYLWAPGGKR